MKCLLLLLVVRLSDSASVPYDWTDWARVGGCSRKCSEDAGIQEYDRDCFQCEEDNCTIASEEKCPGERERKIPCYNATECEGRGIYIGEWTEWHTSDVCPLSTSPCRGRSLKYKRKCLLPRAYADRSRRFKCPDASFRTRSERCLCVTGVWSEWSEWSECPCHGVAVHRRQRSCKSVPADSCRGNKTQLESCQRDLEACAMLEENNGPKLSRKVRQVKDDGGGDADDDDDDDDAGDVKVVVTPAANRTATFPPWSGALLAKLRAHPYTKLWMGVGTIVVLIVGCITCCAVCKKKKSPEVTLLVKRPKDGARGDDAPLLKAEKAEKAESPRSAKPAKSKQ